MPRRYFQPLPRPTGPAHTPKGRSAENFPGEAVCPKRRPSANAFLATRATHMLPPLSARGEPPRPPAFQGLAAAVPPLLGVKFSAVVSVSASAKAAAHARTISMSAAVGRRLMLAGGIAFGSPAGSVMRRRISAESAEAESAASAESRRRALGRLLSRMARGAVAGENRLDRRFFSRSENAKRRQKKTETLNPQ